MSQRKTDTGTRTNFRTDRFFCQDGLWYFNTREGTLEGPYATRKAAESYLKTYITLTRLSSNLDMTLEPTEDAAPAPAKRRFTPRGR